MKKKTVEERIEEILCGMPDDVYGSGNRYIKPAVQKTKKKILIAFSNLLQEIVGEDIPNPYDQLKIEGINQAKQEIREKARKLGIKI